MKREILISATPQETRVAILEDSVLVELMVDQADSERLVGDIYLGHVQAVLPGIQAAFVDIGTEKAAFLHVSDVGQEDDEEDEGNGGNGGNGARGSRRYPPIQDLVQKGQRLMVQATKEPIGTKGPRVTTHISLPGRFLVFMPESSHIGVSRKIETREERTRLRAIAREVVPKNGGGGVIIRTAGEELTREVFEREYRTLAETWEKIERRARGARPPALIHREAKLTGGIIRDVFTQKVDALICDSKQVYNEVHAYLKGIDPGMLDRLHMYTDPVPLFDKYGIEDAIREAFQRRVDLPSGGYIIIEPTEALVSIDVNTGRYTGRKDPEKTILRTNLDAAREIARQLRLRDVGGIIVADFIDMETRSSQDRVLQELRTHLNRDRARTRAFQVSELGLVEMTRQRVRPSLYHSLTEACSHCGGTGRVFRPDTVLRRIERAARRISVQQAAREITIRVHPEVALHLIESEPDFLGRLRRSLKLAVDLRDDPLMRQDEFRLLAGPAEADITGKYAIG